MSSRLLNEKNNNDNPNSLLTYMEYIRVVFFFFLAIQFSTQISTTNSVFISIIRYDIHCFSFMFIINFTLFEFIWPFRFSFLFFSRSYVQNKKKNYSTIRSTRFSCIHIEWWNYWPKKGISRNKTSLYTLSMNYIIVLFSDSYDRKNYVRRLNKAARKKNDEERANTKITTEGPFFSSLL